MVEVLNGSGKLKLGSLIEIASTLKLPTAEAYSGGKDIWMTGTLPP